jgi:carbon monoxide dehydrogenase subunit G
MSLRLEGERLFSVPVEQVWPKLSDARFLVHCIPDAVVQGQPERDHAECTVKPNLSFAKGDMQVTIRILEAREPNDLRFSMIGKGVGSSNEMETSLTLTAQNGQTQVRWVTDIRLGGLLKLVPSGLIRGAAQKMSEDVWNGIAARIGG